MSDTVNEAYEEAMLARIEAAIRANWDDAMEIGCLDHGGYQHLAEAAYLAARERPCDPETVASWSHDRFERWRAAQ